MRRFVFLDESGAKTNMTRLYARAFDGGRIVDSTPHVHWHTTTMISSLRLNGDSASMVIGGSTDGAVFQAYVDKVLSSSLEPGDIVVADNLSPHTMPGVREALFTAIGDALKTVTAADAAGWFASCGYIQP